MSTVTFDRDDEPRVTREPSLLPGGWLGRYELMRPIGRGGMGDVWLARQNGGYGFRRLVAMKTIRPEHAEKPAFRRMFLHEAHIAASIRHTNVVEVLDLGEDDGIVYQVMPLVDGASLHEILEAAPGGLGAELVARIGTHVARGLHAAHTAEDETGRPLHLVHRDVSPHNVLVGIDGFAKIGDFGIACTIAGSRGAFAAGKRKYMAPEAHGVIDVDARTDVYALGVVMSHALGRNAAPPALARALRRAKAREPHHRFDSAAQLADAIEDAIPLASAKSLGEVVQELCPPAWSRSGHRAA